MQIVSSKTGIEYAIYPSKHRENPMPCPECSSGRKKSKATPFSWNAEKQRGFCLHCQVAFFPKEDKHKEEKIYVVPEWKNKTECTERAVKWFESRMISQKTINENKIYSDTEWMPQFNKEVEVICFPYFRAGQLVNIKYRGQLKSFKLFKDAELIPMNVDCIDNFEQIIIVEGEIDLLSLWEIGYRNVISVPNGATGNLDYMDKLLYAMDGKLIILAVDNDIKGLQLRTELVKRFGIDNCLWANMGEFKDSNEVLCKKGGIALKQIIENAEPLSDTSSTSALSKFEDSIITPDTNVIPPVHICKIREKDGNGFVEKRFKTLGNISLLQGKAKSGKTLFESLEIPAIIDSKQHEAFIGYKINEEKDGVMYFDTEQDDSDAWQVMNKITSYAETRNNFWYSLLREYSPSERKEIIENALQKYGEQLKYVVIDGIGDLIYNSNDIEESAAIVFWLMKCSKIYNVHICCILHENPQADNKKAQGHLGTMLYRKCETVASISNTDCINVKIVKSEYQRGTMPFKSFKFAIFNGVATCDFIDPNESPLNSKIAENEVTPVIRLNPTREEKAQHMEALEMQKEEKAEIIDNIIEQRDDVPF